MLKTIAIVAALALPLSAHAGTTTATVEGKRLSVETYKPNCTPKGILIVFHGDSRATYMSGATRAADRECLSVYAPIFPERSYSNATYQMGGVKADGPTTGRTVDLVDDLIAWAQARDGDLPVYLFGHSAGGQFLSRVAAYALPAEAARIVVANPSTWVLPTVAENAPYGFDMTTDDKLDATEEAHLRAYLAAPVTVFLGSVDTGSDNLATGSAAQRQGKHRLDRGLKTFAQAEKVAADRGWPFGWRLVMADGVGHSGSGMLRAPELSAAIAPGLPTLPKCVP